MEIKSIGLVIYIYLKLYSHLQFGNIGTRVYIMLLIYIYLKLLSGFTVDTIGATHRGIGLIWFISTTSRGFLSILTVDFPSLLRSSVNLTFGSTHMSHLRRLVLSPLRLPYLLPHCGFPFSAPQFGKSYVRKHSYESFASLSSKSSSVALLASSLWISLLCSAVR